MKKCTYADRCGAAALFVLVLLASQVAASEKFFCMQDAGQNRFLTLKAVQPETGPITYEIIFTAAAASVSCTNEHMWTGPADASDGIGCYRHAQTGLYLSMGQSSKRPIVANASCTNGLSGWEFLASGCLQNEVREWDGDALRLLVNSGASSSGDFAAEADERDCTAMMLVGTTTTAPAQNVVPETREPPSGGRYCISMDRLVVRNSTFTNSDVYNAETYNCTEDFLFEMSGPNPQNPRWGTRLRHVASGKYLVTFSSTIMQFFSPAGCEMSDNTSIPLETRFEAVARCYWVPVWTTPSNANSSLYLQSRRFGTFLSSRRRPSLSAPGVTEAGSIVHLVPLGGIVPGATPPVTPAPPRSNNKSDDEGSSGPDTILIWIAIGGIAGFVAIVAGLCSIAKHCKRKQRARENLEADQQRQAQRNSAAANQQHVAVDCEEEEMYSQNPQQQQQQQQYHQQPNGNGVLQLPYGQPPMQHGWQVPPSSSGNGTGAATATTAASQPFYY